MHSFCWLLAGVIFRARIGECAPTPIESVYIIVLIRFPDTCPPLLREWYVPDYVGHDLPGKSTEGWEGGFGMTSAAVVNVALSPTACPEGTYGRSCSFSCGCQNGGTCDPVSGTCRCPPGVSGDMCQDGQWGQQWGHTKALTFHFAYTVSRAAVRLIHSNRTFCSLKSSTKIHISNGKRRVIDCKTKLIKW